MSVALRATEPHFRTLLADDPATNSPCVATHPLPRSIGLLWLSVINQQWTSLDVLVGSYTLTVSPNGLTAILSDIAPDLPAVALAFGYQHPFRADRTCIDGPLSGDGLRETHL